MEKIFGDNYYESDNESGGNGVGGDESVSKFQADDGSERMRLEDQLSLTEESDTGADDDDQEYQDVAQAIEDNLLQTSKKENTENSSGGEELLARQNSISFDEDIIFPGIRRNSEQERENLKRKELKSKKEMEEEEREKMQ